MRNQLCGASRKNNGKEKESSKEEEALSFFFVSSRSEKSPQYCGDFSLRVC